MIMIGKSMHDLWVYIVILFSYREVEDYMSDKINYVVTSSPWDENFDEVLLLILCFI